jgi:nitroreductase
MDAIEALTSRRSPVKLVDPAPSDEQIASILSAAIRAPDHGRLRPWRFIILRGEARERLGKVLADALEARAPNVPEDVLRHERAKPLRSPLMIVVAAAIVAGHKIPVVEQLLAAGAATQNIMLAAHAMGYGAMWRTGDGAYDDAVKKALGLKASDAIVGFLYLGTSAGRTPIPPDEPTAASFMTEWSAPVA